MMNNNNKNNKKCEYCEREIPYSNNLPNDIVIFCDNECFSWQEIEDD